MDTAASAAIALADVSLGAGLSPFPDPGVCTMPQIIFMAVVYGYVLFQAANMLSEGSELLLLVPPLAPLVGSVVLPVLGAVPDGVMVLFSGMGPDAQNEISVGVGALAGSTIMLLTLPWFLAVYSGRVSIKDGECTYNRPAAADKSTWEKLMPQDASSLSSAGVGISDSNKTGAKIMLATLLGYIIIQGAAFQLDRFEDPKATAQVAKEAKGERMFALAGLVVCVLGLLCYLKSCASANDEEVDDHIADANVFAIREGRLTLRGAMASLRSRDLPKLSETEDLEQAFLKNKQSMDEVRRMCKVLAPFWSQYDVNGDNQIDFEEFRMIFRDINETISRDMQMQMFKAADQDCSNSISFEEFVSCLMCFSLEGGVQLKEGESGRYQSNPKYVGHHDQDVADVHHEEEDMPEDLAELEPAEQQRRIKSRAFQKMALGTLLVIVFSDPMVDLLSEMGKRLSISPFYISFVLAPIASNSSELVASFHYGRKRTLKSITTSLSTLLGAAVMNNTFCLGIFLGLVYFRKLAWEFSAETIAIVVVQIIVALMVLTRRVQKLKDAYFLLALYPASLLLVWVLENKLGLD